MVAYSTREAARKLGITEAALSRYIKVGKVPTPKIVQIGRMRLHSWSESDIEHLRELLPKITNGRKTRYQKKVTGNRPPTARRGLRQAGIGRQGTGKANKKKQSGVSSKQSVKAKSKKK